jgi:hypothetical protein
MARSLSLGVRIDSASSGTDVFVRLHHVAREKHLVAAAICFTTTTRRPIIANGRRSSTRLAVVTIGAINSDQV